MSSTVNAPPKSKRGRKRKAESDMPSPPYAPKLSIDGRCERCANLLWNHPVCREAMQKAWSQACVTVGTMFSGLEGERFYFTCSARMLYHRSGGRLSLAFRYHWCCDSAASSAKIIRMLHGADVYVFKDAGDMAPKEGSIFNEKGQLLAETHDHGLQPVVAVDIIIAGSWCGGFSPLNKNSSDTELTYLDPSNKSCATFFYFKDLVDFLQPLMWFLENGALMDRKPTRARPTNPRVQATAWLQKAGPGYTIEYSHMKADVMSRDPVNRHRLYMHGTSNAAVTNPIVTLETVLDVLKEPAFATLSEYLAFSIHCP